jgi:molecular chaperone Hsp33
MLKSFSQDDRDHMVENGLITVTCEFCSSTYVFEPDKLAGELPAEEPPAGKPLN